MKMLLNLNDEKEYTIFNSETLVNTNLYIILFLVACFGKHLMGYLGEVGYSL